MTTRRNASVARKLAGLVGPDVPRPELVECGLRRQGARAGTRSGIGAGVSRDVRSRAPSASLNTRRSCALSTRSRSATHVHMSGNAPAWGQEKRKERPIRLVPSDPRRTL